MPKFDVVVGNPPFQEEKIKKGGFSLTNSGKAIWPDFVILSFNIIKRDGFVAFVTPDSWRIGIQNRSKKEVQDLIWNNNIIETNSANKFFDVGGNVNIDYWIVSPNKDIPGLNIDPIFKKFKFLPHSKNKKIKQFYEDIIEQKNNFELSIRSNFHYKFDEIRQNEKGDNKHPYPHVNTIPQHMKNLYDWYDKKTESFDDPKVITSVSVSKKMNSFFDPGKKGTGHGAVAFPVKDEKEGNKLVKFLNNSKIIKEIEKETQNEKGFTQFPLNLFKFIPKSWVERFNNGEDL